MRPWFPLVFVAFIFMAGPLHAAEALAPGSWSVQFSVQPNFTLGSFQGSNLSLKRHLGGGRALRMGLSVSVTDRQDDFVDIVTDSTILSSTESDIDTNLWSLGVSAYYLWYSTTDAPLHVYWGGGPFGSFSWGSSDQVRTSTGVGAPVAVRTTFTEESNGWAAGLALALGVEWQVARRIGVFAEYESSVSYASSETVRGTEQVISGLPTRITGTTGDSHRIQFNGSGGRLGVSAYF